MISPLLVAIAAERYPSILWALRTARTLVGRIMPPVPARPSWLTALDL